MVNSKKMNKSTVAVVVLALLLVLSLILTATGAWFTDKASSDENGVDKKFGTVVLKVTSTEFGTVAHSADNADAAYEDGVDIMPGDSVSYSLTVAKGDGSEDFYYIVMVKVSAKDSDGKEVELAEGAFTADDTVYDTTADGWTGAHTGKVTLDGEKYGNTYKNVTITLSWEVRAIQKANIKDTAAAKALLTAETTEGVWDYETGVKA